MMNLTREGKGEGIALFFQSRKNQPPTRFLSDGRRLVVGFDRREKNRLNGVRPDQLASTSGETKAKRLTMLAASFALRSSAYFAIGADFDSSV